MKTEIKEGKTITVFDNVEEMKWHYHARLCRNSADALALFMVNIQDVKEANKWLKTLDNQYEVKT